MATDPNSTEKRARGVRRPESRESILMAACDVFADQGFSGASMRIVALAANTSPALLHHYFGTKVGLFTAVQERTDATTAVFAAEWVPGLLAGGGRVGLHGAVTDYVAFMRAEASLCKLRVRRRNGGQSPDGLIMDLWVENGGRSENRVQLLSAIVLIDHWLMAGLGVLATASDPSIEAAWWELVVDRLEHAVG